MYVWDQNLFVNVNHTDGGRAISTLSNYYNDVQLILQYWLEHGIKGIRYVKFVFSLGYSVAEFQSLQLIVLEVF